MANSVDPDQTAPIGAVCSGSTQFASILSSSVMLGNYLQQTTSAGDIFRCIFFLALRVNCLLDVMWLFILHLILVAPWVGLKCVIVAFLIIQGSYRQDCVKFKDFSRTSQRLSYCFQGLKLKKNTDLHVKILLLKC